MTGTAEKSMSPTREEILRLPELLAPAGDWPCARAAVENGADAIYFGLEKFNARIRAQNFTEADLPRLMEFLHRRGVRGYVTLNTLVFENELADAARYLRTMIAAGVDAVIVQDVGICRMIRAMSPDFPIHASTQMTVTSAAGVEFARELGCNLVVLARECPIADIEAIRAAQAQAVPIEARIPIEVFVHGALCVAYSGQCLTSESLGGRSANRGECAQACRMPYELISDGKPVPLGDRKYLLSPQDLAGLPVLPDLVRAGVASLKIEGRLKSPEYVASITRIYREALDNLKPAAGNARTAASENGEGGQQYKMEMAFSRGLYTGWFRGINNQALVHGRFGKKRGVFLGTVTDVRRQSVAVQLETPLKPGDGVVFDAGNPEENEEGGRVYEIRNGRDRIVELHFGRGEVNFGRIHTGDRLWKTSDPELERQLRKSFEEGKIQFQRPVHMEVHGAIGKLLTLIARDEDGHLARVDSVGPLETAEKHPLTTTRLREQLGRLGGTPFRLSELENRLPDNVLLPVSELNRLRRAAVAELERQRAEPKQWTRVEGGAQHETAPPDRSDIAEPGTPTSPQLITLVRSRAQLDAALESGVETIYCELENPKHYRDAVAAVRATNPATEIFVAPPRVFRMGEDWTLNQVRSCDADGYLVRNCDHLKFFAADRRIGDYSLNVANHLSAEYFLKRFGLERVTASYDLNCSQLEALLGTAAAELIEVTIHQHMPMFHMEHCVFCAFLSEGTDYTNCGRPCDHHDVQLRDRAGAAHPVKADAGCRNTVFNALAQTGAEYAPRLAALGVKHFRIEFLNEAPALVRGTIERYRQLLRGEITGAELWRELKLLNQLGVTRGQMAGTRG